MVLPLVVSHLDSFCSCPNSEFGKYEIQCCFNNMQPHCKFFFFFLNIHGPAINWRLVQGLPCLRTMMAGVGYG